MAWPAAPAHAHCTRISQKANAGASCLPRFDPILGRAINTCQLQSHYVATLSLPSRTSQRRRMKQRLQTKVTRRSRGGRCICLQPRMSAEVRSNACLRTKTRVILLKKCLCTPIEIRWQLVHARQSPEPCRARTPKSAQALANCTHPLYKSPEFCFCTKKNLDYHRSFARVRRL